MTINLCDYLHFCVAVLTAWNCVMGKGGDKVRFLRVDVNVWGRKSVIKPICTDYFDLPLLNMKLEDYSCCTMYPDLQSTKKCGALDFDRLTT